MVLMSINITTVWFSVGLYIALLIHSNYSIMFVQPTTLKSSSVETLRIDPATNNVVVKFFNNVKHYIYTNVDVDLIADYMLDGNTSAGQFVNSVKQSGAQFATF